MIIVFYGQPHSGKTTLAKQLQESLFLSHKQTPPIIDGDEIREIFKNKDFSKEGRIKNLNRISDIATYLESKYEIVIISAVYPILEAREYLNEIAQNVKWVHLSYDETRGRENFHVKDFEMPKSLINTPNQAFLNTTNSTIIECVEYVLDWCAL